MSLSPNHDDLVHAQEGSSDRALETAGAVVHPFSFYHPDMFSYDMISPDLSATTEAPVGNDGDSDIDCQVNNTLLMIILQEESKEENKVDAQEEEEHPSINVTTRRKKRRPKRTAMWTDQDGRRRPILPRQTYWYSAYVSAPDLDNPQFHVLFRLRFRLPYAQFLELNHRLENEAL